MACNPPVGGQGSPCSEEGHINVKVSPMAPGLVTPNKTFIRSPFMGGNATINGQGVKIWGFNDGYSGMQTGPFPSPAIRVRQGDIVHTKIYSPSMPHTIHHHGIEPRTEFDGVSHTSFDVLGFYTYQWRASHAGTYFYHCHTNTVLHAEMGMYGALIVDPPDGPGKAADGTRYDVEAIWAVDDIDTSWHCMDWDQALCGGDAGLNDFNPDLFCITGKGQRELDQDAGSWAPAVAIRASRGQTVLLRYITAGYAPQRVRFPTQLGDVYIVAEDGRVLPQPRRLPAGSELVTTSAERFDIILNPTQRVTKLPIPIDFFNYRSISGSLRKIGEIRGYATIT